ncbi:ataxin-2 homolog isoform X2 [Drosophila tropicalis]|uniref:ataxin-2 homolog isoform X2 n=1 Tax=Drosophila tropicalis TaxID=46794 RepID=UPI0035ABA1DB
MLIPKLPVASLAITSIIIIMMEAVAAASGLGQPEIAVAPPPQPLMMLDMHHLSKRMDLEVCIGHFDVHKNTIIRTGESQAIGGKYLQGLELDTIEECERLCCETDACDVYIFERKSGGYCYLFECGPPENFHCKFTRHANYTSAVLTPQVRETAAEVAKSSTPKPQLPHIPSNNISQQEWELTNLKLKPEVKDSNNNNNKPAIVAGGSVAVASVAAPSTSGVVQSPNVVVAPVQSAPLGHCGRFQFTCHSGECVAIYNACDGIPQCEDGSDEGPECNAISSSATKVSNNNNNLDIPKPIVVQQQQYQPMQSSSVQQQQQQQQQHQVLILGPPPPPPPPPPRVNNREDAAAWTNRKLIVDGQQQQQQQGEILNADEQSHIFNHKGGLQLQQQPQQQAAIGQQIQGQAPGQGQGQVVQVQPGQMQLSSYNNNQNLGASSVYGMSGVYLTPPQQQQQPSQQQQQQLQPAALQPLPSNIVTWPKPVQIAPHQPQQQLLVPQQQQQQSQTYAVIPPPPPPPPQQQQKPQQSMLPVLNSAPTHDKGQLADDDYDYDEEEKSTEAPKKKQRKHKKIKTKTSKDPIELALEQNKEQHQQQQQQQQPLLPALPVPVAAVHEQYKAIHENLALEFRDHDGHSERPGGAVLSLTMGLLVTAALAILIGCRMRTVGRRARRVGGKSPYSQEADFLVNGMYL